MAKHPFTLSRRQLLEAFAAWPAVISVEFRSERTVEPPLLSAQLRDLIDHQESVAIISALSTFERFVLTSGQRPVEAQTELSVTVDNDNFVLDLLSSNRAAIRNASRCEFEPFASQAVSNGLHFTRRCASPNEVFRTAESVLPKSKVRPSPATLDDRFLQLALDIERRFPSSISDYSSPFGRLLLTLERAQVEVIAADSSLMVRAWADDMDLIKQVLKRAGLCRQLPGLAGLIVPVLPEQVIELLVDLA